MVAQFKMPADLAIADAMFRWHQQNPAGYHWAHKRAIPCPFDVECRFGVK